MQTLHADAAIVEAAQAGDRDAFAEIYGRYADRLHDFCHSMLRNPHDAADATQDTFLVAAERLSQLRDPSKLRPWLYAIARNECIRRSKRRARTLPSDDMSELVAPSAPIDAELGSQELGTLVWDAAGGLAERDRALLDLHLRQGLDGQELADAIGMTPSRVYVIMSRLRDQVERSLGALLVARAGRKDCPELDAMLSSWDGRLNPLIRKRVARHIDACDVCAERRRTLVSPLALLAGIPMIPAPIALRDRVLAQVAHSSSVGRPHRAGRVSKIARAVGGKPWLLGGIATLAVTAGVAVAIATLSDGDVAPRATRRVSTGSTTGMRGPEGTLPRTGEAPADQPGVKPPSTGSTSTTNGTTGTTRPQGGGSPGPPTSSTSPTSTAAPPIPPPQISGVAGPPSVCFFLTALVYGTVTSSSPPLSVQAVWTDTGGGSHVTTMHVDGSFYYADIGPLGPPGSAQWRIRATDAGGRTSQSATQSIVSEYCPT